MIMEDSDVKTADVESDTEAMAKALADANSSVLEFGEEPISPGLLSPRSFDRMLEESGLFDD